jgi:hypothetical protein
LAILMEHYAKIVKDNIPLKDLNKKTKQK